MTATLLDAIRSQGDDHVAALIIDGGNPVNTIPGSDAAEAFGQLDLLVSIDPFITETGRLAHYILPPPMMLERHDITGPDYETHILQVPYAQYVEPAVKPPAGAEFIDDWRVFWELGRRLNLELKLKGHVVDYNMPPDNEELIRLIVAGGSVPFDTIRQAAGGRIFDVEPMKVQAGNANARFAVAPADVVREIADLSLEGSGPTVPQFRFSVRRMREVQNTQYHGLPAIAKRVPENPVWMHPDDVAALDLVDGSLVEVRSAHGALVTRVAADNTMRRGVAAMTHGWGGNIGTNVNLLTDRIAGRDPINAMPILTGFAVTIRRHNAAAV